MKSGHALVVLPLLVCLLRVVSANPDPDAWTESVRIHFLQEVLENQYLRSPLAVVLDLTAQSATGFKKILLETAELGLPPDREVLYLPVNEAGITNPALYDTNDLTQALFNLQPMDNASIEDDIHAGPLLSAVVSATQRLPFDSAVILVAASPPRDNGLADATAQMLIRKRARLYVIWMGEPNSGEEILRETALLTGGAHYYTKTNSVVRPRMLRIENSEIDQETISSTEVTEKLESRILINNENMEIRVQITGNVSQATLIDPEGRVTDLLEMSNGTDIDISVSTKGTKHGVWLLLTDGEPSETYDVNVTREALNETEGEIWPDANEAGSQKARDRQRRSVEDKEKSAELERFKFPEATEDQKAKNGSSQKVAVLGQQKSLVPASIPIIVELASGSNLEVRPGATTQLRYDIINNVLSDMAVSLQGVGKQGVVVNRVEPSQVYLTPFGRSTVTVEVASAGLGQGGAGILTLNAYGAGKVTSRSAYIYFTTSTTKDTWSPDLSYNFHGDCKQYEAPSVCDNGQWSLDVVAKDEDSGLLRVLSEPFGLLFESEFIAGTKSPVKVTYVASCCKTKVDIWAEDLRGNYKRKSYDVMNQGLLAGEIAAVVVGAVLLVILIILIVVVILYCRKRKSDKIVLPRHRGESR